jgi:hypothetical protein
MEKFEVLKWLKLVGFEVGLFIAGLFGAFVNTNTMKGLTRYERAALILSGGFCANYITPIFVNILNMQESTMFGMAFVIGYMGMTSIAYTVDFIKKKLNIKENDSSDISEN